jgi:hypothetical protein
MTKSIFILIVISSLALWTNVNSDEGSCAGCGEINGALPLPSFNRFAPIQLKSNKEKNQAKITGVVVAYDEGVVLTDGPCRQSMVVRATLWRKDKPKNPYVLVRRDYGCDVGALTAEMFQPDQSWEFSLIRDSSCDHSFAEIKDIVQMSPADGPYPFPIMTRVAGSEGDKMPTTVKFDCYRLTGEVKPSVRKRREN